MPDGGEDSLKALIKARQQSREEKLGGFFDSLEEKYCSKSKSKKTTKTTTSDKSGSSSKNTRSKSGRKTKK